MKKMIVATFVTALMFISSVTFAQDLATMGHKMPENSPSGKPLAGVCVLYPTLGNKVTGVVTFTETDDGVKIVADIQGLSKGKHGIHIHEYGDCSALDGSSAGGHFNPENKSHAGPAEENRHSGDMGNIEADDTGDAKIEYVDHTMTLAGDESIIGRAVIIHANEDDLKTQPTGNAGARLACGVIGVAK